MESRRKLKNTWRISGIGCERMPSRGCERNRTQWENESDARTHRTPKHFVRHSPRTHSWFRGSFWSAHASSRRFCAASMKTLVTAWPWLAAICSGILYAACFAPFNLTWFCWIALTPLIAAIWFSGAESRHPWLRNLALGYIAGLTFFWIVFSWLTTVTVLGWFVLEFYMAIYFAIWAWFCHLMRPRARKTQSRVAGKWGQMLAQARS